MSFCEDVKTELVEYTNAGRHCDIAELCALINICSEILPGGLYFQTENILIIKKAYALIKKTFGITPYVSASKKNRNSGRQYKLIVPNGEVLQKLLSATGTANGISSVRALIVSSVCCKKAYIRGAFLAAASIANPEKNYHAEFVFQTQDTANSVAQLVNYFGLNAKISRYGGNWRVYFKDSDQISDLFKIIEAGGAMLELENIRAFRDMNNDINRKSNFVTANFDKTATSSANQVLDIKLIKERKGLSYLSEPLRQLAQLRLENTEASLKELAAMLSPPVSKSGINHRFRKISEIAQEIKEG
ncbi:MAG: DNA-binding protein WhiA [Clostridiales bacterium]|jgi:DNA-binding protein WhiA|nr:DNA-binding protein WhiA [Clostridiales bacterium]